MHYDVAIIGAGMSGLAAGIRLAHFDRKVCILEKHYAYGGLNSYYKIGRREFDVGLHAVTNYFSSNSNRFNNSGALPAALLSNQTAHSGPPLSSSLALLSAAPARSRNAPLPKLLRQLRLREADFDLRPQKFSEIRFPHRRLYFTNDPQVLRSAVGDQFPAELDGFDRLVAHISAYDDLQPDPPPLSGRAELRKFIYDPTLVEMLLCPLMFYGNPAEGDMDFSALATMFKSIFLEGFGRPLGGVRTILRALVRRFRESGGKLCMNCGVERLEVQKGRVSQLILTTGERITADNVLSSAGYAETMRLIEGWPGPIDGDQNIGRVSFVETIAILDRPPAQLGFEATIVFENDRASFDYQRPEGLVDFSSRIVCCPNNYVDHESLEEGVLRMTWLANFDRWNSLGETAYKAAKQQCYDVFLEQAARFVPNLRRHIVLWDLFTPRTIRHYTGHLGGAVYGSPVKHRDGRTPYENLFICGTDQGYVGIVGAMLSGITVANANVLAR